MGFHHFNQKVFAGSPESMCLLVRLLGRLLVLLLLLLHLLLTHLHFLHQLLRCSRRTLRWLVLLGRLIDRRLRIGRNRIWGVLGIVCLRLSGIGARGSGRCAAGAENNLTREPWAALANQKEVVAGTQQQLCDDVARAARSEVAEDALILTDAFDLGAGVL